MESITYVGYFVAVETISDLGKEVTSKQRTLRMSCEDSPAISQMHYKFEQFWYQFFEKSETFPE